MSSSEPNIHVLDAAYKPFPPFSEWAAHTSVDTKRWNRYKAAIEDRAEQSREALRRAREVVKRAAAIDTGAIEGLYEVDRGFTFTVAFETAAWELELAKRGENVRSLFEAQLHAYDYVLDLATKAEPISEAAIRRLHEVVCAAQDTYRVITAIGPQEQELVKGRYKVLPNHVRTRDGVDHSYAPVDVTPAEMARLVAEMRTESFLGAHPVIQAAYAHYGLVVIHPFADGNGRVARALASAFTYRAISMPIMILSEHKTTYLDALEDADRRQYQSFVDFMLARSLDTMTLARESARGALSPTPKEGLDAINNLYLTRGGYSQDQIETGGRQFIYAVRDEILKSISRSSSPKIHGRAEITAGSPGQSDSTHRSPMNADRRLEVRFNSDAPAHALLERNYDLWLPKDASGDDDLHFERGDRKDRFTARIDEVIPSIVGVLQIRIGLFADRVVGEMLAELKFLAEKSLRGQH